MLRMKTSHTWEKLAGISLSFSGTLAPANLPSRGPSDDMYAYVSRVPNLAHCFLNFHPWIFACIRSCAFTDSLCLISVCVSENFWELFQFCLRVLKKTNGSGLHHLWWGHLSNLRYEQPTIPAKSYLLAIVYSSLHPSYSASESKSHGARHEKDTGLFP